MKKASLLPALLLALAVAMTASTTPKSSAKSTTPAAHKAAASSSHAAMKTAAAKEHTLTGCLSGPNAEGGFLITNRYWKKGVEVGGMDMLRSHVGHEVRLTGMWVGTPGQIGLKEVSQKSKSSPENLFKVSKIDHLADTCSMPAKSPSKKPAATTNKKS